MAMKVGDKFRIDTLPNVYKGKVFTIINIEKGEGFTHKCTDQNGDVFYFSNTNFDYYGQSVKRVIGKAEAKV